MANYPEYVQAAMRAAQFEQLGGEWFGAIPQLTGLWSNGPTIEDARNDLLDSLHDWIDVHMKIGGHRLPEINGVSIYEPLAKAE